MRSSSGAPTRRVGALLSILALITLVLAGCGSSGAGAASPVATTTVDLPQSYKFAPASIVVSTGATVTWTNHDNFSHSVQFLDGGLPGDPLVMQPGQTVTFTFDKAGTFNYQCHFHPQNMKGTVTVSG
jgi:plastocyanin